MDSLSTKIVVIGIKKTTFMQGKHTQYPEKVNVWARILGDPVIGATFIEENVNDIFKSSSKLY